MWYLFLQIWLWLVLAFALGWVSHWFFCCRGRSDSEEASLAEVGAGSQALFSHAENSEPDDLKQISGVGNVLETTLNSLGITHFAQIAQWQQDDIDRVEKMLKFHGRIQREDWIEQAKVLAAGGETEFSRRAK